MLNTSLWISAARPKTLIAGAVPALLGSVLAYHDGSLRPMIAICTFLSALAMQIGSNFANDYFDFLKGGDTAERIGPTRLTSSGLLTPAQMRKATLFAFLAAAIIGLPLLFQGGPIMLLVFAVALAIALGYTGGPFPLAYHGLGDVAVFFVFGPAGTAVTYYLQTGMVSPDSIILGLGLGTFSAAILMVNNLRDLKEDTKSGKRTVPVRFGRKFGSVLYLFEICFALWVPALFVHSHRHIFATSIIGLLALPTIRTVLFYKSELELIPALGQTAKLLLLYTLILSIGWLV